MTPPEVAAGRFAAACLLGGGLGLWYGFLRPLRPKHTILSDSLFVAAAGYVWLILFFGICRGDLRLGYYAGLFLGGFGWEMTGGRLLRPVFFGFWRAVGRIWSFLTIPLKKILKFAKILFASWKKWVTIKCNNCRHRRQASGGKKHGRNKTNLPKGQGGVLPQQDPDQGGRDRGYCVVYGNHDHPAAGSE